MTFPAKFPQLNETQLTERARTVLIRVIRVAFPHSRIPDGPYERTADIILQEAQASTWFRVALTQGLNSLDGLAGGDFCALDDDKAYQVLKRIEGTDFFGFIRRTTVLNLYDDPERSGRRSGYEGLVVRQGRLPQPRLRRPGLAAEPRIEEYDGPVTFEPIWQGPGVAARPTAHRHAPTPASGDGEIQGNLEATLSTQQDPARGRPAGRQQLRRRRASDGRASSRTTIRLSSSSGPAPAAARWRTN